MLTILGVYFGAGLGLALYVRVKGKEDVVSPSVARYAKLAAVVVGWPAALMALMVKPPA